MHKDCVYLRQKWTWGIVVCLLLSLVGSLALTMLVNQRAPVKAADLSSSYTWKPVKFGGGGFVTGLVIHPTTPNIVYARTDVGGAYRWDSGSQSWSQMLHADRVQNPITDGGGGSSDQQIESIALSQSNDQIVYMAAGGTWDLASATATGRILKSTDRGQNWTDSGQRWIMGGNSEYRQGAERLAVDPANDSVVYFGSRKEGLWVSNDAANSWSQIPTSQIPVGSNSGHSAGVKFVIFDPTGGTVDGKTKRIYVGVAGHGVYRSEDAGASWSNVYSNDQIPYDVAIDANGTLFVSIINLNGDDWVYRYKAGSWQNVTPASENYFHIAIDPFNTDRVFVSPGGMRDQRFYRSTDGGTQWSTLDVAITASDITWVLNTDEELWLSTARIVFDPFTQNQLWFAQGTGVWRTSDLFDSEVTWTMLSKGIEEMVANDVAAPPGGKPVFLVEDRNGFYGDDLDSYQDHTILTNKFSAGTSIEYSGGTPQFLAVVSSDTRLINPDMSGYSTDGGQNWTLFSGSRNYADLYGGNIAVSADNTNTLVWLPTNNKQPYISTDRGATWNKISHFDGVSSGLHTMIWWEEKKALDADKVDGGVFYLYSTNNGGEFHRSTNNGQSWEKAPGTAPASNNDAHVNGQVRAVPGKAGHVWMSTSQGGLHYTTDKGNSWTKVDGIQEARSFNFGKAIGGASYPAIYTYARVNDQWGIYRSADQGASWDLVSAHPMGIYDHVNTVSGDMNIEGRVYVGFGGNSFVYGDTSGSTNPTPTSGNSGGTVTLNPSEDRDNYATNAGADPYVNASIYQIMYFKFNLSTAGNAVNDAKLRLYRPWTDNGTVTLTAYQVNSDSWAESDNASLPALGTQLTTTTSSGPGWIELPVTSFVASEKAGDGTVTIAVKASSSSWTAFHSKDNGNNKPELVVTSS